MSESHTRLRAALRVMLVAALLLSAIGCHQSAPPADSCRTTPADATGAGDQKGEAALQVTHGELHLTPAEVQELGVVTQALQAARHAAEAAGFAVVVTHEGIAQSLADLRTAAAVARQSEAAYQRNKRLAGTPGAMPVDTLETAERQSTVDAAALDLARQRLSSAYGLQAPWHGKDEHPLLNALASGAVKLVRVTFPFGALADTQPAHIRLGRIGMGQTATSWDSNVVWAAPADSSVPGRSFFATVEGQVFGEGERLVAWTPLAPPMEGVIIPASAAVLSGGRYWCFIESDAGTFVKTEFEPSSPVSGGYFVTRDAAVGDKVVVRAAGQLLARQLNPSTEVE